MGKRDKLFNEAKTRIKNADPCKESILYHNIYTLKMSGNYLYSIKKEVMELVNFLNSYD